MKRFIIGILLAMTSVIAFASTFVVGGELTRKCGVSPLAIVTIRFTFAAFVMMALEMRSTALRRRLFFAPTRRDWIKLAIIGPIGTSVMAWFVFAATGHVSSANAAMSDAISPLMIFLYAAIVARQATKGQIFGAICGFVGVLFVIGIVNADGIALSAYSWGDVFVFFAALTWAIYTVAARDLVKRIGANSFTIWTMLFGVLFCLPWLPFLSIGWPTTLRAWGLVGYICVVPTLVAFWAWNAAQQYLPMSTLAMTAYFTPVAAAGLGCCFFDESMTLMQWLGTVFVCFAALVEVKGVRK